MATNSPLQVVPDEPEHEDDQSAEEALLAAFASTREREKTEVAEVIIPRYANVPKRDTQGRLQRGKDGKPILAPLALYFRRMEPGSLMSIRDEYTSQVPVRRRGRTEYEERTDGAGMALAVAYAGMVPWCREMYFDNSKLWGDEPVGTGMEFLERRLNLGELGLCLEAVQRLEGMADEIAEQVGKASTPGAR
jgi:hypothetical protein